MGIGVQTGNSVDISSEGALGKTDTLDEAILTTGITRPKQIWRQRYDLLRYSPKTGRASWGQVIPLFCDYVTTQFSTCKNFTRLNSLVLFVIKIKSRLKAWAAISMSRGPITWPFFSR